MIIPEERSNMRMPEERMEEIAAEHSRVSTLANMLSDNISTFIAGKGYAGANYEKNHNASQTAILNQITTLRNELLVLAKAIKW